VTGAGSIEVNGARRPFAGATVLDLLREEGVDPATRFIAVAINGTVVRRADWEATEVAPGDRIEIVKPVSGG
jgi:sulfur carrier protein